MKYSKSGCRLMVDLQTEELFSALHEEVKRQDRSKSWIIRLALREYLERQKERGEK